MKITVEHYDEKYTCETADDISPTELLGLMCRFMLLMGYPPQTVQNAIVNKFHELPKKK